MKIATLGPEGTFSHEAVLKFIEYPTQDDLLFCNTIYDIFEAVKKCWATHGIVPMENSVSGTIWFTVDALSEFDLNIIEEILIPINHNLAGNCLKAKEVTKLYCHQQAYTQCERFIRENMKKAKVVYTASNGESAMLLLKDLTNENNDKNNNKKSNDYNSDKKNKSDNKINNDSKNNENSCVAAIVPRLALNKYKLKLIMKNIQDNKYNTTKFVVISKKDTKSTGKDRTTLSIYPSVDKPGLLYSLLGEFAKRSINLSKIESIPSKGKFGDYFFLVEIFGHKEDDIIREAIAAVEKSFTVKVHGSCKREY
ncbi:ACT domain-containing protein [Candidatus Woesearchaeota archaeon]|nr:ACT domain-containing protein [Candidatus Woesearchaeota archaeon]